MPEIKITSTDGDTIKLNVYGRTYPDATDVYDGSWLNTIITLKIGGFSARNINILLRCDELERLSKDIERFLSNKIDCVNFEPMEPWFCFRATLNKRKNIEFCGEVTDALGTGNVLKFRFNISQPDLEKINNEVNEVLNEFSRI